MTPKQQRFVQEYLVDLNATQAAIRAGYSRKTANRIATENLSKPVIQSEIKNAQARIAKKLDLTTEQVVSELRDIAWDRAQPGSVRVRALELLGRHFGMFTDKIEMKTETNTKPQFVFYWPDNGRDPEITAKLTAKAEANRKNGIQGPVSIEL